MNVEIHHFGNEQNQLVVIDDFLPNVERYIDMAAALAPFPPEEASGYPGSRHQLTPDQPASQYVLAALQTAAPVINRAFEANGFSVVEASFAMVTKRPSELRPLQRIPHRDSTDPNFLATLHHLHRLADTGTGFYRHRRTGFERMSEARRQAFDEAFALDTAEFGPPEDAFFGDSDRRYEKIYEAPAKFNRMLIYRGSLLHSGLIPDDFAFDPNPRTGRLTGTIFLLTAPRGY